MATSRSARSVAWLHEVLEWTDISEQELLLEGLSDEELRALRLLTRPPGSRAEASYLGHIRRIALSAGTAGVLAREVKRADLMDRLRHPARRPDGWSPPYGLGLAALQRRGPRGGLALLRGEDAPALDLGAEPSAPARYNAASA